MKKFKAAQYSHKTIVPDKSDRLDLLLKELDRLQEQRKWGAPYIKLSEKDKRFGIIALSVTRSTIEYILETLSQKSQDSEVPAGVTPGNHRNCS